MGVIRRSKGVRKEHQKQPGDRVNRYLGMFVGYVKDNRDVQKMGRLKVWIPEFGSHPDDEKSWFTCGYASPFAGATPVEFVGKNLKDYNDTQTSYGFWAVPPDVGNQVLVMFANGDSTRGFWFACVYNNFMNQMVPGNAYEEKGQHYGPETTTDDTDLPTGEYNKENTGRKRIKPDDEKKPIHRFHAKGLRDQGLIFDDIRGITDSSARRESPSNVYGLLTPGPLMDKNDGGKEKKPYKNKSDDGPSKVINRKGGHQLVLDDREGHERIHLRTRSGGSILLDETNGLVYIINRDGTSWMEMSESGHLNIYAAHSVSIRSEKDFNFRADRDINIESGRNINIKSAKDYVEDRYTFLEGYANSQKEEVIDCFEDNTKKEFIKDFPKIQNDFLSGKLTLNAAFKKALEEQGLPTTSSPTNRYSSGQDSGAETSLSTIQKLAFLRGSHIVGEGFGDSGSVYIQAIQDMNLHSGRDGAWTAEDGNVNLFAGQRMKFTSGLDINHLAGTDYSASAGMSMNLMSGLDMKQHAGGDYHLGVMNHSKVHFRGDVIALLEGENLSIEAQPVWFNNAQREVFQERPHRTKIKLQDFNFEAERIRTTVQPWEGSATFPTGVPSYELTVGTTIDPGLMTINVPTGNIDFSGGTFDVQAGSGGITGPIVGNATIVSGTTPPTAIVPATPADVNNYYPESGEVPKEGLPWPERPASAKTALMAEIPMIYSKANTLPMIKRSGNKEYSLTYHTQILETISRRFMAHEPCAEHEITGGVEERYEEFENTLRFRIID